MNILRQLLLIFSLTFTAMFPLAGQHFQRMSIEDGVSHNLIYCILQDRQGFMWFGTMHGLVKYDGVRYRTFRHDAANPSSPSYDDIISLYQDSAGIIWVGTWGGGLNAFDPQTE